MNLLKGISIKKFLFENFLITDVLWYYTLLAVLLKTIIFLGFTFDNTHTSIVFGDAFSITFKHFAFYFGFDLFLLSFAFLLKNRARLWYLLSFNLFISVLFCIDLWYFRAFNTMPTLLVLGEGSNLNNLSGSILGMMRTIDLVFIFDVILLIPIAFIARNTYRKTHGRVLCFAFVFVFAIGFIIFIPLNLYYSGRNVKNNIFYRYDSTVTSQNLSPLGFHLYSIYTFFGEGDTLKLTSKDKTDIKQWFEEKKEELPDNKYKGMFAGQNLLIIQVESLEKFVINQKLDGQEITPNLNKLLKNSLYFSDVREQVHEGNTVDAELLENTSVFPLKQGATSFLYPYTFYNNSLPKIMQRKGYYTTVIHPDAGSFWNWMIMLKAIGFEKCVDVSSFNYDERIIMGLSDGSYLKQVEPMIVKQKQPFFNFMLTQTSHTPYTLPVKYQEIRLTPELRGTYLSGYIQCIHYTDKQIGILLDGLKKDGILNNTVVVIYGDHEGVHKYFPDKVQEIKPAEDWWLDNQKQTPLIIYQDKLQGEEIKTTGGEIDILPTISYLMGVDEKEYSETAMGRNLLKTNKSFAVLQGGEYVGDKSNAKQVEHDIKGLDIADMIIRSNYFKGLAGK
jgi:lipoteichoic acid synthase